VLEVIVFICGAALMGIEFLAARMLAPSLGSSLFVWGSVISIVMVALSLGYWLGGQIADRYGSTRTLAPVIAVAGLFTALVPALNTIVLPAVEGLGARTGSLLASAIVFFVPSLLLAMVSPLGVRLVAARGVDRIGRSAGSLYAISTAGSIAGTIVTAFWLIPLMGLDPLVIGIAVLLFFCSALATTLPARYSEVAVDDDAAGKHAKLARWVTLGALIAGAFIGFLTLAVPDAATVAGSPGERIIFRKDTQYHRLLVTENAEERFLRFDRSSQSSMYLDDPYETGFLYPNYLHLVMAAKPDTKRVLIVGLGGGTLVKRMLRDYPEIKIDVVEIDPVVVDVAKKYFDVKDDPRLRVFVEDGRGFIRRSTDTYDVIVMDAYYADSLPFHLTTEEFFKQAKARLAPDGVLAYNVIASVDGERSKLFRSMYRTASAVWRQVWVFPIEFGTDKARDENRNIIVLATDNRLAEDELRARIANRVGGRVTVPGFEQYATDLLTEAVQTDDVPLLTDQHAPVDSLIKVN
jgi:spermidine synthase